MLQIYIHETREDEEACLEFERTPVPSNTAGDSGKPPVVVVGVRMKMRIYEYELYYSTSVPLGKLGLAETVRPSPCRRDHRISVLSYG